jgi:hypothetical protein
MYNVPFHHLGCVHVVNIGLILFLGLVPLFVSLCLNLKVYLHMNNVTYNLVNVNLSIDNTQVHPFERLTQNKLLSSLLLSISLLPLL